MVKKAVHATTTSMATAERRMSAKDFTHLQSVPRQIVISRTAETDTLNNASSLQVRTFASLGHRPARQLDDMRAHKTKKNAKAKETLWNFKHNNLGKYCFDEMY